VLGEILQTQSVLPEQILFLQPHGPRAILDLQHSHLSVDDPMRLFLSTTDDLNHVSYQAEIVGWDNKNTLPPERSAIIERILKALEPKEGGLYDLSKAPGGRSLNLIHVRRVARLERRFPVQRLLKVYGGNLQPRTQAGGWAYVWCEPAPDQAEDSTT